MCQVGEGDTIGIAGVALIVQVTGEFKAERRLQPGWALDPKRC